jgi:hypothetical protein
MPRRDDREGALIALQIVLVDRTLPDPALEPGDEGSGLTDQEDPSLVDDRHLAADLTDIVHDVGREDDHDVLADLAQQVQEAPALLGIEPRRGLVDDDQLRFTKKRLRDAEALPHAAGVGPELLPPDLPEVGHSQKAPNGLLAPLGVHDPFQHGKVVEHRFGRDPGVNAELLGQVAEDLAYFLLLMQDVEIVQCDRAGVALLERGDGTHQGRLAGAVGPHQTEHPPRDLKADILERLDSVAVRLG